MLGLTAGLLLMLVMLPAVQLYMKAGADQERTYQENLTAARGEAFAAYQMVKVKIEVLADGSPASGASVSPDGQRWYTPEEGVLWLDLVPGTYRFKASYQNRLLTTEWTVRAETDNTLIIDVEKAPQAPELLICEAETAPVYIYPLEISAAQRVTVETAIDHVRVIRREGSYALEIQTGKMPYSFYHIKLLTENEWGRSETHIGLKKSRSKSVVPVYTVEDLAAIRENLSGSYRLMNDLDMSAVDDWIPIGSKEYPFTGQFDGGSHQITGFHAAGQIAEEKGFALFDYLEHAEIRNIILREPDITPQKVTETSYCSALLGIAVQSLIENCAVIGGRVAPAYGSAAGMMTGSVGIIRNLYNSADVYCGAPNKELKNTGGVVGSFGGYGACLANEGEVTGTHLTGGIVGFANGGFLTRCVNSGYIWGSTMVGEYPAGAIAQSADWAALSDSYFQRGQAPIGGRAFTESSIRSLLPVPAEQLLDPSALPLLGSFQTGGEWGYAGLDADGPVPAGIFPKQTEKPAAYYQDGKVILPAVAGVKYFYTLDGSYPGRTEPVESAKISLSGSEMLMVTAARQGWLNSEVVTYTAEGGSE